MSTFLFSFFDFEIAMFPSYLFLKIVIVVVIVVIIIIINMLPEGVSLAFLRIDRSN